MKTIRYRVSAEMAQYAVTRRLHYARDQLFDLVADVESYPCFVPYLAAVRVDRRGDPEIRVDMLFVFGPLRRRIQSTGVLHRPSRIVITSTDAPFRLFRFDWRFQSAPSGHTDVEFSAEFEFRSGPLRRWARENPQAPEARPQNPVNLNAIPPLF